MIASILIIAFSVVLLGYWFRYSCMLLLRDFQEQRVAETAADPRFTFAQVRANIEGSGELDPLHRSLDRDFQLLQYLVEHAAGLRFDSLEDRLLTIDYKVMRFWYNLARVVAPKQARRALAERASVLGILVARMCERAGVTAEG
jgi:hypothetical protein